MSTRDRRLARAERLRGQATRNAATADSAQWRADDIASVIPMGQPILVGHHSESRHRRDAARIESATRRSVDAARLADEQAQRADNIEAATERAIYDDDPDAVERLTAKLATLEERRNRFKAANAAYRREHRAELAAMTADERADAIPYPPYVLTNLGGVISATRKRLETLSQPERPRVLVANRPGECRSCTAGIQPGERILWFRRSGEAEHESHSGAGGAA